MKSAQKRKPRGTIIIDERFCKGCELCISECPKNLLSMADRINKFGYYPAVFTNNDGMCNGCTLCAIVCPDVAIEVSKTEISKPKEEKAQ